MLNLIPNSTLQNPNSQKVLIRLIKIYQQYVSPMLGANCRYVPSCSEYALQAITKYGTMRGGVLAIKRLLRCRPLGGFGYDPVP